MATDNIPPQITEYAYLTAALSWTTVAIPAAARSSLASPSWPSGLTMALPSIIAATALDHLATDDTLWEATKRLLGEPATGLSAERLEEFLASEESAFVAAGLSQSARVSLRALLIRRSKATSASKLTLADVERARQRSRRSSRRTLLAAGRAFRLLRSVWEYDDGLEIEYAFPTSVLNELTFAIMELSAELEALQSLEARERVERVKSRGQANDTQSDQARDRLGQHLRRSAENARALIFSLPEGSGTRERMLNHGSPDDRALRRVTKGLVILGGVNAGVGVLYQLLSGSVLVVIDVVGLASHQAHQIASVDTGIRTILK